MQFESDRTQARKYGERRLGLLMTILHRRRSTKESASRRISSLSSELFNAVSIAQIPAFVLVTEREHAEPFIGTGKRHQGIGKSAVASGSTRGRNHKDVK
jgi:hypothetical protein